MGNTEKIEYGSCRHWDATKGYGFIFTDDGRDFFAHWSDLMMGGFRSLHIGDKVSFRTETVDGKPDKAVNVTVREAVKGENNMLMNLIRECLIKKHGTESTERMAQIPSTETYFACLKENVTKNYEKYKEGLHGKEYEQFLNDIYALYKEYKLVVDKVDQTEYGKVYLDYAEKIVQVFKNYGIKQK